MAEVEERMDISEVRRNIHGPSLCYSYTEDSQGHVASSLPDVYPDIHVSLAQ